MRQGWAIAISAAAAGLADLIYASTAALIAGRGAEAPWRVVGSAWFSDGARGPDAPLVTIGILTHFAISLAMMAAFALAAARYPQLYRRWRIAAACYGLALYAVMYGLVIPMRFPGAGWQWNGWASAADVAAHVLFAAVGVWVLVRSRRRRA